MSSRIFTLLLLATLVAAPGLAVGLNRLAKWLFREVVATQRQLDRLDAQPQYLPAQPPKE